MCSVRPLKMIYKYIHRNMVLKKNTTVANKQKVWSFHIVCSRKQNTSFITVKM